MDQLKVDSRSYYTYEIEIVRRRAGDRFSLTSLYYKYKQGNCFYDPIATEYKYGDVKNDMLNTIYSKISYIVNANFGFSKLMYYEALHIFENDTLYYVREVEEM